MRPKLTALVVLAALAVVPGTAAAQQDLAKAVIKTFDLDSVLAYLKAEAPGHQLDFIVSDKHGATFERNEGNVLSNSRQVPLIREVLFHFEKAKTGTRVIATETLIVRNPGGQDVRHEVDQTNKATDLQEMLNNAKAKSMPPGSDTSKAAQ